MEQVGTRHHVALRNRHEHIAGHERTGTARVDDAEPLAFDPVGSVFDDVDRDAEPWSQDRTELDELRHDRSNRRSGDGEADAATIGTNGCVHTQHRAVEIDERASGVSGIDLGVRLQDTFDRPTVGVFESTIEPTDDTEGDRLRELTEGAAECTAELTQPGRRAANAERWQVDFSAEYRKVGRRISPDQRGRHERATLQADLEARRVAFGNMCVRNDEIRGDRPARARARR